MTLQTCPLIYWPEPVLNTAILANTNTADAAGEYTAWVGVAAEDMVITHFGFLPSTATGSPTADLRIETVDATTGLPTGTLWAVNSNIVTGTLVTNTWVLGALTASASITKGQVFCAKVQYNSGTSFLGRQINGWEYGSSLPYKVVNTGTPTISSLTEALCMALGSSSTTFYNVSGLIPSTSTSTTATFNNTNSAKRGLRFQVPFKCRCVGIWHWDSTSIGDLNALIENDAGTELSSSSTAFDGDLTAATSGFGVKKYFFDNAVILSAATWYRAVVEPSTATNISIGTLVLPSASYSSGTPWGSNAHYATFASGSWTDTATDTMPIMGIIIDQLDDGVNSGSGLKAAGLHAIEQGI